MRWKRSKNKQLREALLQPYPFETPRKVPVWVGDPIAIKDPTTVQFFAQAGNNLLILGMQDEAALGMQITSLLSLAAHYPPERLRCYVIDFTPLDLPHAGRLEAVKQLLPHRIQIVPRRKLQAAITEISDELADRKEADRAGDTAIYLLIYGLPRVRDLRPDEDAMYSSFGETAAPLAQLGGTWRDQEHARFAQEFQQTMVILERFIRDAEAHIPILTRKASHIRNYLNQR